MVRSFSMTAVALLMTAASISNAGEPRRTSAIAGISIGTTRAELETARGMPTEIRNTGDALDPEWYFGGKVVVAFWDRGERVAEVRTTDPASCTDTGVCPGMGLDDVGRLVGGPIGGTKLSEGINQYASSYDTCWLEIAMHGGRVEAIAIKCQP